MDNYVYIALFSPLISALFAALFAVKPKKIYIGIISSLLVGISLYASILLAFEIVESGKAIKVVLKDWIVLGSLNIPFGFVVDQISVTMMVVVTIVSTMVHIYSIGYMKYDKSFNRFFAWLSAFVFAMMMLVMSDNFVGLFIGWEGVGLCSWGLIGFWYHKKDQEKYGDINVSAFSTVSSISSVSPSWAANEAFIQNRVADLGMLLGIFLIYWNIGSFQYDIVFSKIASLEYMTVIVIAICLLIGAMGKSAQFPFNTWLANAMEGPTPVSALIHAATMVTAGVFLLIRSNEIFFIVPFVGDIIVGLGVSVAFGAALMALVSTNMKKIIAFSTLSQLGYMFVAAGLGAYWIALFHLATHAFFKSVLFLGAGNVMHAMNDEINIKKMGGLAKYMPYTTFIMIIASLALAGIFPFAGFYSKDMILESAFANHAYIVWFILWLTAGLTAFYSFRLILYVFFGQEKFHTFDYHPKEAYWYVIASMVPLAILAISAGWFQIQFVDTLTEVLPPFESHLNHVTEYILIGITISIVIVGISYAYLKHKKDGEYLDNKYRETFLYKILVNQYYLNHIWDQAIIANYNKLAQYAFKNIELKVIDRIVDGFAYIVYKGAKEVQPMQSGNLSKSLKIMAGGILILLILLVAFVK